MAESPTSRTMRECRKRGWIPWVVERAITRFVKRDCFWVGDIIVIQPGQTGSMLVQATSGSNFAARVKKILGLAPDETLQQRHDRRAMARAWLEAGNRIEVWGWRKLQVKPRPRWEAKVREIGLYDLQETSYEH